MQTRGGIPFSDTASALNTTSPGRQRTPLFTETKAQPPARRLASTRGPVGVGSSVGISKLVT